MDDVDRLEQKLREWGATDDELAEARRTERFGDLALELAVREPGPLVPFAEAAAQAGFDLDDEFRFDELPPRSLKGFGTDAPAYRVRR